MTLGERIQRARERKNLTKTEAAKLAGLPWKRWHEYETDQVEPSASKLFTLAEALGVTVDSLRP